MAPPCPDYRREPVGLHPWVEGVCQFWGRCGCIVDGRTCYWEGRPPEAGVVYRDFAANVRSTCR